MAQSSRRVVIASVAANVAVAITKFVVSALTGSTAMLAEGVHSLANCFDGGLLLLGERRSRRPPDEVHPFGHGRELYFWSFVVAVVFFALGAGFTTYEGVRHVMHPEPLRDVKWNYIVLGVSALLDGLSFRVGIRAFNRHRRGRGFWTTIRESKNPTLFSTVLEDAADMMGLFFAFVGVFLSQLLNKPELDGVASIAIGALMGVLALVLLVETHGLLIGESASPELVQSVRASVSRDEAVAHVEQILTVHAGPDDVALVLRLRVRPNLSANHVARRFAALEEQLRREHTELRRVFFDVTPNGDGA